MTCYSPIGSGTNAAPDPERYADVIRQVRQRNGWYWDRVCAWRENGRGLAEAIRLTADGLHPSDVPTWESIADQLTEDTGRHMLDSGGAYGRHWERDAGNTWRTYREQPRVSIDAYTRDNEPDEDGRTPVDDVTVATSTFHVLADVLEYDAELDDRFVRWGSSGDRESDPWLGLGTRWLERIGAEPVWWSSDLEPVNTYNGEHSTDRVLWYIPFHYRDEDYVLLSTHNGCDVRGGYSRPRVYRCSADASCELDVSRLSMYAPPPDEDPNQTALFDGCEPVAYTWDSDNAGYSWHDAGCSYPAKCPEFTWDDVAADTDDGHTRLWWTNPNDPDDVRQLHIDFYLGE